MSPRQADVGSSYLTTEEAASRAGITVRTLYRKLRAGEVRSTHLFGKGRQHFFTADEVESWLHPGTRGGQAAGNSDHHPVSSAPTPRGEPKAESRLDGIAASTAGAA